MAVRAQRVEAEDGLELHLRGELDAECLDQVMKELRGAMPGKGGRLVVDLTGVGFIDSCGAQLLFKAQAWAVERGFELQLRSSAPVRRAMTVMGLEDILHGGLEPTGGY